MGPKWKIVRFFFFTKLLNRNILDDENYCAVFFEMFTRVMSRNLIRADL